MRFLRTEFSWENGIGFGPGHVAAFLRVRHNRSMPRPTLKRLARTLEKRPWNRPGTDKTWVLRAMAGYRRFLRTIRSAKRVDDS